MIIFFNENEFIYTTDEDVSTNSNYPWARGIAFTMSENYPSEETVIYGYAENREDLLNDNEAQKVIDYHKDLVSRGYNYPIMGQSYGAKYVSRYGR